MADATKTTPAMQLLAAEHQGMRVDYIGLLWQCRQELEQNAPGYAEMLRQLQEHLRELGQRWYAGDTAVVDELLQLYSIEKDARQALKVRMAAEAGPSEQAPRHVTLRVFRDVRRAREDFDRPRPGIVKEYATMKLITSDGREVRYAVAPDLQAALCCSGLIFNDVVFMEEVPADVRFYLRSLERGAGREQ